MKNSEGRKDCGRNGSQQKPRIRLGNRNSFKHGYYSAKAIAERKLARKTITDTNKLIEDLAGLIE